MVESRGDDALVAQFDKDRYDVEVVRAALRSAPQVEADVIAALPAAF